MGEIERSMSLMRTDWWALDSSKNADISLPGIYEWRIGDAAVYVGKAKRLRKRIREYPNNVRKLLTGAPYRRGKATAFRDIHHHLRRAHDEQIVVRVRVLENCENDELNSREQYWIAIRRAEADNGGPQVLNATRPSRDRTSVRRQRRGSKG